MGKFINVHVGWVEKNFCASYTEEGLGVVTATDKTFEGLKKEFEEALQFSADGWKEDGHEIPEHLCHIPDRLRFDLDASALLRVATEYTTMAAISRASGINQGLLSHYVTGLKHPRKAQMDKIRNALQFIGNQLAGMGRTLV